MPVNDSNVLEYAQQLMNYTRGASDFTDKMDVVLMANMMERMIKFGGQIKQVDFKGRKNLFFSFLMFAF